MKFFRAEYPKPPLLLCNESRHGEIGYLRCEIGDIAEERARRVVQPELEYGRNDQHERVRAHDGQRERQPRFRGVEIFVFSVNGVHMQLIYHTLRNKSNENGAVKAP